MCQHVIIQCLIQPPVTYISLLNWIKSRLRAEVTCYTFCSHFSELSDVPGLVLWSRSPGRSFPTCLCLSQVPTWHARYTALALWPHFLNCCQLKTWLLTPFSWVTWPPLLISCDWLFPSNESLCMCPFLSAATPAPAPSTLWISHILGGPPPSSCGPRTRLPGADHFPWAWEYLG